VGRDVAQHIVRTHFPSTKIVFCPPVPQDPTKRRPDLALAFRVIPAWRCKVDYEEGVARTVDSFRRELATPLGTLASHG
jgi:hypothetical protein